MKTTTTDRYEEQARTALLATGRYDEHFPLTDEMVQHVAEARRIAAMSHPSLSRAALTDYWRSLGMEEEQIKAATDKLFPTSPHDATYPPERTTVMVEGHALIHFTHKRGAGNGSHAYGVGLFVAPEDRAHCYVTWTVIDRPATREGELMVESGDYCFSLQQALASYEQRGGEL